MDLKTYTADLPHGGMAKLAAEVNVTPVYLSQLAARQEARSSATAPAKPREPSPELCVLIETATGKAVKRWDLRPSDWYLIWPELIGENGAPDIEAKAAA